jgi:hypothetical protein
VKLIRSNGTVAVVEEAVKCEVVAHLAEAIEAAVTRLMAAFRSAPPVVAVEVRDEAA